MTNSGPTHIIRSQLSAAATEWANSDRDMAFLYTGSRLTATQHAMAQMDVLRTNCRSARCERDFLHASIRSYRRSMRRRRMVMVLLLVLLVGFATETFVLLSR